MFYGATDIAVNNDYKDILEGQNETDQLLNTLQSKRYGEKIRHPHLSISFILAAFITLFSLISLLVGISRQNIKASNATNLVESDADITFRRFGYSALASIYKGGNNQSSATYIVFNEYAGVIEPYSPMIVELSNQQEGMSYFYSLHLDGDNSVVATGPISLLLSASESLQSDNITVSCNSYDLYTLDVSTINMNGETVSKSSFKLICMYVRREIRKLQEDDRNKVLDAMLVIYTLDEDEGIAKYGDNFHSSTHFTEWHYFNAAQRDADHIHEGSGFLLQHIKATNNFERAMQAVDPSVSLPYWDFTIEGQANQSVYESPIFTPEIFGSCPLPEDMDLGFSYSKDSLLDAAIPDGRWAFLEADLNTKYPSMIQPYGYLRAPWNLNPSPYISRYTYSGDAMTLPACFQYLLLINETVLNNFHSTVAYGPHGTAHTLPGGLMGCELLQPFIDLGYIRNKTMIQLCASWGFVIKELYRDYKIEVPSNCNAASYDFKGLENCTFVCDDVTAVGGLAKGSLEHSGYTFSDPYDGDVSAGTFLGEFICSGNASKLYVGDHLESASPADPSFWVIHPTLDRALQAKYIAGGFTTDVWPTYDNDTCTAYSCNADASTTADSFDCCYGHHLSDKVLDYVTGERYSYIGITNGDVMLSLNPRSSSYSLPYIYEHFMWPHCEAAGVSIAQLIDELQSA